MDATNLGVLLDSDVKLERPNKETTTAMLEAERLARDPSAKRYTDLEELFADLKARENRYRHHQEHHKGLLNCNEQAAFNRSAPGMGNSSVVKVHYYNSRTTGTSNGGIN